MPWPPGWHTNRFSDSTSATAKKGATIDKPCRAIWLVPADFYRVGNVLRTLRLALVGVWLASTAGAAAAPAMSDDDCLVCHSDNTLSITNRAGRAISLFVDKSLLVASVHKTNSCI